MYREIILGLMGLVMLGAPALIGCDRTVHEEKTERTSSDGTKTTDEKKVTKNADGSTTVKETHQDK